MYQGSLPFDPQESRYQDYIQSLESEDFKDIAHPGYAVTVDHALEMAVHAVKDSDMTNPKTAELIQKERPNEAPAVYNYRVDNFRQITIASWKKISNTLFAIFNPRLMAIHYPPFPKSPPETIEDYIDNAKITEFIKDEAYQVALRDANGVVAVLMRENALTNDVLPEPVPMVFESKQVIDYHKGKYYLLESYQEPTEAIEGMTGRVFITIDARQYLYIVEVKVKRDFQYITLPPIIHDCGEPPVVHMPGESCQDERLRYNLSYLSGILPNWNEALIVKSDYQAVRTRHAHPKFWQFKIKCPKCNGQKTNISKAYKGKNVTCGECEGTGIMKAQGPADTVLIDAKMAESGVRDPGGYLESSTGVIEFLRKDAEIEINQGLSAVNMDHLSKDTNIEESGEAKRVGRTDLNTFMDQVATGIYEMWDRVNWFVGKIRYGTRLGADWVDILPVIERPKTYDLKSPEEHAASVRLAKDAGLSHGVIAKGELDYTRKQFGEDSDTYNRLRCKLDLDPLPGIDPAASIQIEADTRKEDRWLHFNIDRLIGRAIDEHAMFYEMDRPSKLAILYGYVSEELAAQAPPPIIPSPPVE